MSEQDRRIEQSDAEDGVALSPYDADLETPREQAEPAHYSLDEPAGYDESASHAEDVLPPENPDAPTETPRAAEPIQAAEPALVQEPLLTAQSLPADSLQTAGADAEPEFAAEDATTDADTWAWQTPASADEAGHASWSQDPDPAAVPAAGATVQRTTVLPAREPLPAAAPGGEVDQRRVAGLRADSATDEQLFDGHHPDKVPSRGWAHTLSVILMLLLLPVAWYLLSDAGARMTLPAGSQWDTGTRNLAAIGELAAGLVVLVVVLLTARRSSLGATLAGVPVTLAGAAFVVFPAQVRDLLDPYLETLRGYNDLGGNIAHHLVADGSTGRFLTAGVALLLIGAISHGARRNGRREQEIKEMIGPRHTAA